MESGDIMLKEEYFDLRDDIPVNHDEFVRLLKDDITIENESRKDGSYKASFDIIWRDLDHGYVKWINGHKYSFGSDTTGSASEIVEYMVSEYELHETPNICEIVRNMSDIGKAEFVRACKAVEENSDGTFTLKERME